MHITSRLITLTLPVLSLAISPCPHVHGNDMPSLTGHVLIADYEGSNSQGTVASITLGENSPMETLVHAEEDLYSRWSFFMQGYLVLPRVYHDSANREFTRYVFYNADDWMTSHALDLPSGDRYKPVSAVMLPDSEYLFMTSHVEDEERYYHSLLSTRNYIMTASEAYPDGDATFALCASDDGVIYGFTADGYLCRVESETGKVERLMKVTYAGTRLQASFYDGRDVAIYRTIPTDTGCRIERYDLLTGKESLVHTYEEITAIHALAYDSLRNEMRVPAAIEGLEVTLTDTDANVANISFTAPAGDLQEQALASEVHVEISVDQVPYDTLTTMPGTPCSLQLRLADGEHTLSLQACNEYGRGITRFRHLFTGYDNPQAVTRLNLDNEGDIIHLSWEQPTGIHGNPLDTTLLQYRITRYPDQTPVANTREPYCRDTLPAMPGLYYYGIQACLPDYETEETFSADFYHECILKPPYHVNEWNDEMLGAFTIVDANGDGSTWQLFTSIQQRTSMCYTYNTTQRADDRLYTPAIRLHPDTLYEARLYLRAGAAEYEETFDAYITYHGGNEPVSAQRLAEESERSTAGSCHAFTFCVPQDSLYSLCIRCTSEANRYMLHIDSLALTAVGRADVPDSVTSLAFIPDSHNRNVLTISCRAPRFTVAGEKIDTLQSLDIYRNGILVHRTECPVPGATYTCTDTVTQIDNHEYEIAAGNAAGKGISARRTLTVGTCNIPYSHDFATGEGFFSIIDRNGDGTTWHRYNDRFTGCMRYLSDESNDADDWLISPPIALSDTLRYEIHCRCCVGLSIYPESLRIMMGVSPDPDGMSLVIKELTDFDFINDTTVVVPFSVPVGAHYYIGIQACSRADSYAILLRNILVQEYDPAAVPQAHATTLRIWGGAHSLTAESGSAGKATIHDLAGRIVRQLAIEPGRTTCSLPPGIYLVRAAGITHKVVVW